MIKNITRKKNKDNLRPSKEKYSFFTNLIFLLIIITLYNYKYSC